MSPVQKPPTDLDWLLARHDLDPFMLVALPKKKIKPIPRKDSSPLTTEEKNLKEELLANDSLGG